MSFIFGTGVNPSRLQRAVPKRNEKKSGWFISLAWNSISSAKMLHRYVSFDRLGNKIITGIANPLPVQSQWDRQSSNVPTTTQPPVTTVAVTTAARTTTASTQPATPRSPRSLNWLASARSPTPTERERSMAFCYRNLMNQYNQLVRRYFSLSRSRVIPTVRIGPSKNTSWLPVADLLEPSVGAAKNLPPHFNFFLRCKCWVKHYFSFEKDF